MFKFLKDKLKGALSGISERIEKEVPEVVEEVDVRSKIVEKPVEVVVEKVVEKELDNKKEDISNVSVEGEKKSGFLGKFKGLFKKNDYDVSLADVERVIHQGEKPVEVPKFVEDVKVERKVVEKVVVSVIEKSVEKVVEKKVVPSVQDIAFGRTLHVKSEASKKEVKPLPSVHDLAVGRSVGVKKEEVRSQFVKETPKFVPSEIEKFKKEELAPVVKEFEKLVEKVVEQSVKEAPVVEEIPVEEVVEEKKSFFAKLKEKIVTKRISDKQFDELFWDLEVVLLENNVAVEVIEKIKIDLKGNIVDKPIARGKVSEIVSDSLKKSIVELFDVPKVDIFERMEKKKPIVICFLGVNGSGKTTTIAKIAYLLQSYDFSCVIAAADTFRAAAIDQLEQHAKNLGVKLIKHDYGSDPAAVAFDAIKYATAKNVDAVLIDTAGRLHSNTNLMDEMRKIIRVANPDLKIFVGESITGNDCVEQAKQFNELVGIDGIVLAKADVDEKGGAAISVSFVTKKPILYLGVGQRYEDLEEFNSEKLINSFGF